jgi:chemotaxis protein MotB
MSRRKHKGDDHGDVHADERWLVTYADMITLLLAVFIVMYALSDTNLRKFNAFAQSLSSAFNTDVFSGSSQFTVSAGVQTAPETGEQEAGVGFVSGQTQALRAAIRDYAITHGLDGQVSVTEVDEGVSIKITAGVLFAPGRARLLPEYLGLLQRTAESLAPMAGVVTVIGHTDDLSPDGALYADNFELSVARALTVLDFMREAGVPERRLRVMGAAEHEPLVPNDTDAHREQNRYVEIRVRADDPGGIAPSDDAAGESFNPVFGESQP